MSLCPEVVYTINTIPWNRDLRYQKYPKILMSLTTSCGNELPFSIHQAQSLGRWQERDALLPAVATLLRASPAEFRSLKQNIESSDSPISWLTG